MVSRGLRYMTPVNETVFIRVLLVCAVFYFSVIAARSTVIAFFEKCNLKCGVRRLKLIGV